MQKQEEWEVILLNFWVQSRRGNRDSLRENRNAQGRLPEIEMQRSWQMKESYEVDSQAAIKYCALMDQCLITQIISLLRDSQGLQPSRPG